MVHVSNCPLNCRKYGYLSRGKSSVEFRVISPSGKVKDQIYCYGYCYDEDNPTTSAHEECEKCLDWVYGEQSDIDFENAKRSGRLAT